MSATFFTHEGLLKVEEALAHGPSPCPELDLPVVMSALLTVEKKLALWVYMFWFGCARMCVRKFAFADVLYICVCVYIYMYICIYIYMYTYMYIYICIYVYMYICIICIHIRIHIHTYTVVLGLLMRL